MNDPETARLLAERVAGQGGRCYFVGGLVRDSLLGAESKDYDIEVHGITPEALEEILDSLGTRLEMGRSFGIYGLRGCGIDIAMPRRESATGRGHRDFRVEVDPFLGIRKAAMRRDFTVNAMMQDVLTGEILDPFDGRRDLEAKILRRVSAETFAEDPLRVLRGAQFCARFGFTPEEDTSRLCKAIDLSTLSSERIFDEMKKALLRAEKPSVFFRLLREWGQLSVWFPEVGALIGVKQSPAYHGEGDAWEHTMLVLDEAAKRKERAENPLGFLLSALTHDFGKAICTVERDGKITSYEHETKGLPLVSAFLARLTSEKSLTAYVLNMTELHMKPNLFASMGAKEKAWNRMLDSSVCPGDLLLLSEADIGGMRPQRTPSPILAERLEGYRRLMREPQITGKDLIAAGMKPGEEMGRALAFAHRLHLSGVPKDKALKQVLGNH